MVAAEQQQMQMLVSCVSGGMTQGVSADFVHLAGVLQ